MLASRAAISVRPGPALLPRRIAYRAFAVSAPHLSLTLVLPELCRSTERAGLWGSTHAFAGAISPAPVRPPEPPSRVAQSRRRRSLPHVTTPHERAPRGQERRAYSPNQDYLSRAGLRSAMGGLQRFAADRSHVRFAPRPRRSARLGRKPEQTCVQLRRLACGRSLHVFAVGQLHRIMVAVSASRT